MPSPSSGTRVVHVPLHSGTYPGLYAVIDDDDAEIVTQYQWYPVRRKTGWHAQTCIFSGKQRTYLYMHQLIAGAMGEGQVDHVDCDGLNNSRCNLRPATSQQNIRNQRRRSDNRSGFKGVSWHRQKLRWRAAIVVSGKQKHLGLFDAPEEAALVYDEAARLAFGDFARLNFPCEGEQQA